MDLASFRDAVDHAGDGITSCQGDLKDLYRYVGLPIGSNFTSRAVSEELYRRIKASFSSGHQAVWLHCRTLRNELIHSHILDGESIDPYFSVLDNLQDAVRVGGHSTDEIDGDWMAAIQYAYDNVQLNEWSMGVDREMIHTRAFEIARAAKRLRANGYILERERGKINLDAASATRAVETMERLTEVIGGLNVARHIFLRIAPIYDPRQERHHLVNRVRHTGGGSPQIPFGYLLLLAVKHFSIKYPLGDTKQNWSLLCQFSTDYVALLDVQSYSYNFWGYRDASALLPYLREMALYDTMFRIPQTRPKDLVAMAEGVLLGLDFDKAYGNGWSIRQALDVIRAVLYRQLSVPGPCRLRLRDVRRSCPNIDQQIILMILREVLSHPLSGANQQFSRPWDAPIKNSLGVAGTGHDFFLHPLLQGRGDSFFLVERSVCSAACLESLFTILRAAERNLDKRLIGPGIERFLRSLFATRGVPTSAGKYTIESEEGECDLVVETEKTIIVFEIKKKPLTRMAKAGSDAHVIRDLAQSVVDAQVQAGRHEVRLRLHGYLDLVDDNAMTYRLELKGREVERVAVSLFDYGSFQDRWFLEQFLQGMLGARFTVNDPSLMSAFKDLNSALEELGNQVKILGRFADEPYRAFFHCWFLSVPQLLVLLDDVDGPESLRSSLWETRHIATGSSDFYYDFQFMRNLKNQAAAEVPPEI